jgi:hypothetical protein
LAERSGSAKSSRRPLDTITDRPRNLAADYTDDTRILYSAIRNIRAISAKIDRDPDATLFLFLFILIVLSFRTPPKTN